MATMLDTEKVVAIQAEYEEEKQLNIFGHIVWWSLPSAFTCSFEKFQDIWNKNLGQKLSISPPKSSTNFLRIMASLETYAKSLGTNIVCKQVENTNRIVYIIAKLEKGNDATETDISRYNIIIFDKQQKKILANHNDAIVNHIKTEMENLEGNITSYDVSRALINLISNSYGYELRDRGGLYFIPKNRELIRNLKKTMNEIFSNPQVISTIPLITSTGNIRAVYYEVKKKIEEEMESAITSLKEVLEKSDVKNQDRMLATRFKALDHLRQKLQVYSECLSFYSEELKQLDQEATKRVQELLLAKPTSQTTGTSTSSPSSGS